jgi:outer membrane protein TolC
MSIQALLGDRSAAMAQLNALLNRPAGAQLASPEALPPLPAAKMLVLADLIDLAERRHPLLAADRAEIAAAEGARALADKAWYPDVTLGVSAIDRDRRLEGYEAMVSFRIPIRGDLKDAARQEAVAKWSAAAVRLQATLAALRGEIEAALRRLEAMQTTERLIRDELLPQSEAAWRAALAGYEQGGAPLDDVLDADRRRREARLDALRAAVEQRLLLAQLEQMTGGEL